MPQPLSILHLHPTFDPADPDGWSARMVRLMHAFGDRARHTIMADNAASEVPAVFAQDPPPLTGGPSVARYEAIARFMRGHDLVLTWGAAAIDGVMARRVFPRGAPPVVHHEDPALGDEGAGVRLYRRLALGAAYALVVSGPTPARVVRERWRQPAARIHTIATGIDLAPSPDAELIAGFRRHPREVVIGVVAALSPDAALPALVRAVGGLSARFRLVIVGEGEDRAAIERAALAMGIDDRVELPGVIAGPGRFLPGFDLLVLPPRPGRAPTVVLDAMAAGLPVVGPCFGEIGDMVAAENVPHLTEHSGEVRLRDAMQALIADPDLRTRIGAANREKAVATYDVARMIARSAALYAEAAGRPGGLV